MRLRELQKRFMQGIYHSGASLYDELDEQCRTARAQLDIYRGSVLGGMSKALEEVFPVCRQLVGGEFFSAMALRYVKQAHATSSDLTDYGGTLPDFIEEFTPAQSVPYLADVARLEWMWHRAFNAPDRRESNIHALLKIPVHELENIRLSLDASTFLLKSVFPIDRIWYMHVVESWDERISLDEGDCRLLIWRPDHDVRIERIDDCLWYLLKRCQEGMGLGSIIQNAPENHAEAELNQALVIALQNSYFDRYFVTDNSR